MVDIKIKYLENNMGEPMYAHFSDWDEYMGWCEKNGTRVWIREMYGVLIN